MNMEKEYMNRWEKPLVSPAFSSTDFDGDGGDMLYRVRLTKLVSNHSILRTDVVVGRAYKLPEVGSQFFMIAESLTIGFPTAGRMIETTQIQNVERIGSEFQFSTKNSTYKLEILSGGSHGSLASN